MSYEINILKTKQTIVAMQLDYKLSEPITFVIFDKCQGAVSD